MRDAVRKNIRYTEIAILFAILAFLLLRGVLIFRMNVDIDEFSFLSTIFSYLRGELAWPYFTFHVHLFSWLPSVPGDEITWILTGRSVMYLLSVGTSIFLYLTAKLFYHRVGALFSVLSYLSFSNVIEHGTSFRFDPICVFLFILALYLLLRENGSTLGDIVSGLLISVSLVCSLKSVFYVLTIAAFFVVRYLASNDRSSVARKASVHLSMVLAGSLVLFLAHSYSLSASRFPGQGNYLKRLATSGILFGEFFPNRFYVYQAFRENIVTIFFMGIGLLYAVLGVIRRKDAEKNLVLATFLIPVSTLSFYMFSYPYYYNDILVPSILLSGYVPSKAAEKYRERGSMLLLVGLVVCYLSVIVTAIGHYHRNLPDRMSSQKSIVEAVHKIFPSPVPYIDRCLMISSFPMAGIQMTTWDLDAYRGNARPIMRQILAGKHPVFLLANTVVLDLSKPWGTRPRFFRFSPLLREDFSTLQENYIRHWGILYVAGKRFLFPEGGTEKPFEMLIPGVYTVEADKEVWIDGKRYLPGARVSLETGDHRIGTNGTEMEVAIRWGEDLYRPPYPPPAQPIFFGYYFLGGTDYEETPPAS